MKKALIMFLALILIFLTGCSIDPITGKNSFNLFSEKSEIEMGEDYHPQLIAQYNEYPDENLKNYVQKIVSRLGAASHRPQLNYRVTILDTPMVNAFAIPGGRVYVCRGILAYFNSEAELAGVMGHEIGHVCARHSVEQLSQQQGFSFGLILSSLFFKNKNEAQSFLDIGSNLSVLAQLSYSRENEMEADRLGLEYAHKAGFSPLGMYRTTIMLDRLAGQSNNSLLSILSTHPVSEIRTKQARIEIRKLQEEESINTNLNRENYLAQISGIMIGCNPARGIVKDNAYYNTTYKLKSIIPYNYTYQLEEPGYLFILQDKNNDKIIYYNMLDTKEYTEKTRATEIAAKLKAQSDNLAYLGWNKTNGKAYLYLLKDSQNNSNYLQVTHYLTYYRTQLLEIICIESKSYQSIDLALITSVLDNLKVMNDSETAQIKPEHLKIYTVQKNDTWQNLTDKYFPGKDPKGLAWLNDCELSDPLPQKIKLGLF